MEQITRRAALVGATLAAASAFAPPARAALPPSLTHHPGFRAWTPPLRTLGVPMQDTVVTEQGAKRLVDWLDRRPAVVALWASWCAPCLIEKAPQAALARRLAASGAATRILALQIYDDAPLERGRALLDHLGARGLPLAQAGEAAERDFRRAFGSVAGEPDAAILPVVLLIGADGLELGRTIGSMTGVDGHTDYWQDEATFDFLSKLL